MKWQTVAGILTGGTGIIALFTYLFLLSGVDYSFTGDSVCDQLECSAYINVNTSYWEICFSHYNDTKYEDETLFKKRSRSRTLHVNLDKVNNIIETKPPISVNWYVATIKRLADHKDDVGYWRLLKDGDCWKRSSKPNKNKLIGYPKEGQIIKWSFELEEKVSIDPIWISWDYTYENLSRIESVYTKKCTPVLDTKNASHTEDCHVEESYKTVYYDGERKGIKVGDKEYDYNTNVEGNKLIKWNVPIKDRNFEEYGSCRDFEIDKGVCTEVNLI